MLSAAENRIIGPIPCQGSLEFNGVNGHHLPFQAGGADARQLNCRRNAAIGEQRQVFDTHINRLDPVSTSGLDSINVRKREGLHECHRHARCPSCHVAVPVGSLEFVWQTDTRFEDTLVGTDLTAKRLIAM